MIDAVVMADVKQQCLRRDGGFDLGKVLSECAHSLARADIGKGRQQSPKTRRSAASFPSAVLFHSPSSFTLAESLLSLIQPTTTHTTQQHARRTRSAGKHTISALQRRHAAGEGVHVLKLWFPFACECHSEHRRAAPS